MTKIALAGAMALALVSGASLSGCSALDTALGLSVSPQSAMVAIQSFDALETVATGYISLPLCGSGAPITCRTTTATNAIVPAVRTGRAARVALESALNASGGASVPVASMTTLNAAISTLQAAYANYSIK